MALLYLRDKVTGNFVPVPSLKGPNGLRGAQGEKGDPGYTPIKGLDYFTEADKTELICDVLSALPRAEGESF